MSQDQYRLRRPARPPRPVRKSRPVLPVGALVLVLGLVAGLALLFLLTAGTQSLRGEETAAAAATPSKASPEKHQPGIGEPVRDGKFEFVVSKVDCSKTTLGVEHLARTAEGKFCVLSLSVRNIAGAPQYFLGSAQKVTDAAGAEFGDDELAGLYVNGSSQTFLRKIGPGEKVAGKIVFDVPRTTTPAAVQLHDSFLSGGVDVALR
jgi:hypothetical protein